MLNYQRVYPPLSQVYLPKMGCFVYETYPSFSFCGLYNSYTSHYIPVISVISISQ